MELFERLSNKGLSPTQQYIANLVVRGYTNTEVGECLDLPERAIKRELTQIYTILNLKSRAQLIVYCLPFLGDTEFNDIY